HRRRLGVQSAPGARPDHPAGVPLHPSGSHALGAGLVPEPPRLAAGPDQAGPAAPARAAAACLRDPGRGPSAGRPAGGGGMSPRAVVVEGVEIPEALIAQEAQNHPSLTGQAAWDAAAKALAVRALLLQRAEELGLSPEPQTDEAGREETPEEALVRAVLDAEVEYVPPTDAEMLRFYEAQKERFVSPQLYEASHILVEPQDETGEADEAARLLAYGAVVDLRTRPELFGPLAQTLSACPSGKVGGALGQWRRGALVAEIEQALLPLAPGQIGETPVRSQFGWHVLRLDRLIEPKALPFEVVAERIRLHLESRAWASAAARYAAELAARARMQGVALSLAPDGAVREGSLTLGDLISEAGAAARIEPW